MACLRNLSLNSLFFLAILLMPVAMAEAASETKTIPSTNMLANPGFEKGGDMPLVWKSDHIKSSLFSRDTTVVHSGKASLKWKNSDPKNYQLLSQSVDLKPGRIYELSAWIKTKNVKGVREAGATICVGLKDKDGKYIDGGPHPGGQKGTRGWWRLVAYCGPIPRETPKGSFTCYVRRNEREKKTFTGTAWWDDVCFRPVSLSIRMLTPSYKRIIFDGNDEISLEVETWPKDFGLNFDDVDLVVTLVNRNTGETVLIKSFPLTKRLERISFSVDNLAYDCYEVYPSLVRKNDGVVLWQAYKYTIYRKPASPMPKVYFDKHHRCIVNGEPWFPIGLYLRTSKHTGVTEYETTLKNLSDSGFNCFMNYDLMTIENMDQAYKAGLKVIYSVKDYYNKIWYCPSFIQCVDDEVKLLEKTVKRFRNHPALLAWYVNDERGPSELPQHLAHFKVLNELDPGHPAWSVHNKVREENLLIDTFDVGGVDIYPVPFKPISEVAKRTKGTVQATRNSRPVWMVLQIMNWSVWGKSDGRPPTLEEMRCMAWQAICEGANGLLFYSYHDLFKDKENSFKSRWPEIKQMAGELAQRTDILLGDSNCPRITVDAPAWLHWTARKVGEKVYIIAVSDGDGEGNVKFSIDAAVKKVTCEVVGGSVTDSVVSTNAEWSERFSKNEVKIYSMQLPK